MKKKILSFVLAICLIVPAICILSACGEKRYDIEIITDTEIEHIQEIKFSSSSTKKTTYRNSEDTFIEVICDQGSAPDLVFTVGDMQISEYSDYFVDLYDMVENPDYDPNWQPGNEDDGVNRIDQYLQVYTGVLYLYTIPTKDLTGKQTVTYSGDTKAAKVRLTFSLNKGGDDVDPLDGDYEGLSFIITDHEGKQIKVFTAVSFINFADQYGYVFVDYDEEVTITLKSTRPMNGAPMHALYNVTYLVHFDAPDYSEPQLSCSWTYKFPVNYELPLVTQWLQNIFPQEEVA